jgi:hypothetical protein
VLRHGKNAFTHKLGNIINASKYAHVLNRTYKTVLHYALEMKNKPGPSLRVGWAGGGGGGGGLKVSFLLEWTKAERG